MTWIHRALPREADDDPPPPPSEIERLAAERAGLLRLVRRGIRSRRQERILRRITEITRTILSHTERSRS